MPKVKKGKRPAVDKGTKSIANFPAKMDDGYPVLSLRYLQKGFGVEELQPKDSHEFLTKWAKRSKFMWRDLSSHDRHGLGSEKISKDAIKPHIPEYLERDKYLVYRHRGNLPFVGFRVEGVFYVLWIEKKYGELYDHH